MKPICRIVLLANINIALLSVIAFYPRIATAENIKVGVVKTIGDGPVFIAQERGYFVSEGIPVELVYFDAAQPIAVAAVSSSIDFGVTAFTAGFYTLGGQGALKIIAGGYAREAPGFHFFAYIASNQAYAGGLTSLNDFPGHSVAISQIGSAPHYDLGLLIDKYGFDTKSLRILPLQSIANMSSAVSGGQADATIMNSTASLPLIQRGEAKLLGWVGDETPWEQGAAFTATGTADKRHDTVEHFLAAYLKSVREVHDAFTGPDEKRRDGATAPEILAILAKYTGVPAETLKLGIPYFDPDARVDVKDILHQIAWYKSQGMVKFDVNGDQMIDKRYAVPLP